MDPRPAAEDDEAERVASDLSSPPAHFRHPRAQRGDPCRDVSCCRYAGGRWPFLRRSGGGPVAAWVPGLRPRMTKRRGMRLRKDDAAAPRRDARPQDVPTRPVAPKRSVRRSSPGRVSLFPSFASFFLVLPFHLPRLPRTEDGTPKADPSIVSKTVRLRRSARDLTTSLHRSPKAPMAADASQGFRPAQADRSADASYWATGRRCREVVRDANPPEGHTPQTPPAGVFSEEITPRPPNDPGDRPSRQVGRR